MQTNLRILHAEDNSFDAELVKKSLAAEGIDFEITLAGSRDEFTAALGAGPYDLIISDIKLISFDGYEAMALSRKADPAVPFIVVSGSLGEEAAVEMIKLGATDFVLKDRLFKLGQSIKRALTEAADRNERIRAQEELKKTEEQLRQAQKMEAIGQLAGGIAHDFNNLLTVINGRSQLLMNQFKPGQKIYQDLELIYKTGERAAALTRQLVAFSRRQVLEPKILDLNAVTADMDKMLRRLIREDIELATILTPVLRRVKADPNQIEQVIMNLVVNARDAMPKGGKLTIETANVELSPEYCRARAEVQPGKYAMLAVSDTGHGMNTAIKTRIFEPFFTTKERGKGTGLGLSTVYGIIKQSGGHIEVYSEVEKGTTFKIYLPETEQAPAAVSGDKYLAVRRGKERILLVEDEEDVRVLTRDILEADGYVVLTACHGLDALAVLEQQKEPFDLLVTDVVMPDMGGPELAKRVKVLNPATKVLFTSGYTDNAVVRSGTLDAAVAFLQKPFTPKNLIRKVREVLDQA